VLAAIFKATVALLLVGSRPFPMIFPPLMRLSGHSRSQETKWFLVSQLLMSYPASLMIVVAVMTSIESIRVRSVPVRRNNSARKSNCGLLPFFFWRRAFLAELRLGSDPPCSADIA
jgi:hypothetical protein